MPIGIFQKITAILKMFFYMKTTLGYFKNIYIKVHCKIPQNSLKLNERVNDLIKKFKKSKITVLCCNVLRFEGEK